MIALALLLCLAQADPDLGAKWERRASKDLATIGEQRPAVEEIPPEVHALSDRALDAALVRAEAGGDVARRDLLRAERDRRRAEREAAADDRRRAGEEAERTAREDAARRSAAEERLAGEERARADRLAAVEAEAAAREQASLSEKARRREVAVGGGIALVLAAAGALVWRSLRRRGRSTDRDS